MRRDWNNYIKAVETAACIYPHGKVEKVVGLIVEGIGPAISIGSICAIQGGSNDEVFAEVVGFRDNKILLMPFGQIQGIKPGSHICMRSDRPFALVGDRFMGRIVDALGNPIDNAGAIEANTRYPIYGNMLNPMNRRPITEVSDTGIRAINAMITIGKGQRIAIMAGSGVGKSVLMGMIARYAKADVIVIGLIGERGREVRDFVEKDLGREGLKKSVVVAATSDSPPLIRMRGAYFATALAEYFRDQGLDVILMMDSITRFAMSSRDVGLAAGEPPTAKGYTPSFFSQLPRLLERAGNVEGRGSITGIYTVLVEGDDFNEPVSDAVRSIVDGHIVLSRKLANQGHYPAIDVLASISRIMRDVATSEHIDYYTKMISALATYKDAEDLINIGAYVDGSNPKIDYAKKMIDRINILLRQNIDQRVSYNESVSQLIDLFKEKMDVTSLPRRDK
ncbi:MAG: FliI/YscN family ATPase [Pseudomonadota bacterium]